ncbi:aspartate aminotransferase family protein [Flavilitoribacter nigricans]|uniref:Aspartate aminotransferase family protein n=1 Tax=Flavilitoribacter nigricans (strain ATCC 23147 / DSM 23189 / NBRC 102662 / NCIMB 1420 / SS-2) TaxID=1122177 RepID=A0A2D0NBC1_FLAN2|nr:aminotransferase class III-fold pyridoxal phosphate-dependent enzyme [Flavilitoribacter nigricans]PHN05660.1 aspartate aminotransferase family protein [Flavilitoribacter nigricans DSM 23189 = NBRC 102662]
MQLFDVYPLYDLEPVRAEGHHVYDAQGQAYLDLYGGHAVISIGHSHPHYIKTISDQLNRIGFYSNSIQNPLQQELADKLGALSGCDEYQLFLCNSGAEANENALKMASFHNGRTKVIAFKKAFHGRTSVAVNATDNEKIKAPINRTYATEFHEWNDLESVSASLAQGDVCAVIIEGIQGIGGIHVPDPAFLETIADLCKKHDTVLILDEIQSGYGRSGKFFAYQYSKVEPDLITMAKGMGNGFPIGGLLIHPRFQASYGLLGTTFGGNHLACAAGIAVLDVIREEQLVENAASVGDHLMDQLRDIDEATEVRGLGLMIGLEFPFAVGPLRKQLLFDHKVFTGSSSDPNVLRLLPALSLGKAEADQFIQELKSALAVGV